jgi:hypothetical protein
MLDSDGDGLPDSWEMANFRNLNQRSGGDFNGDGISNLDEFLDGTDPKNKNSLKLRLTAYSEAGGLVTVVPTKLRYGLRETVTLTATAFATRTFTGWAADLTGTVSTRPLSR